MKTTFQLPWRGKIQKDLLRFALRKQHLTDDAVWYAIVKLAPSTSTVQLTTVRFLRIGTYSTVNYNSRIQTLGLKE